MAVNIGQLYKASPYGGTGDTSHWRQPLLYNYRYDQLNRITGLDAFYGLDQAGNNWTSLQPTQDFKERLAYDGNGNIQKYLRNNFGETGLPMDSLGYSYISNTNKLSRIKDSAADFVGGGYDLHSQRPNNYAYDSIGNLIRDSIERIGSIQWNVYGKITEIDHDTTTATKPIKNIYYYYDAAGNRIGKKTSRGDSTAASYTWYVRDASGNVMATYTASEDTSQALSAADLHIGEKHIYGSSRLGIVTANYSTDANTDGLSTYVSPWTGVHVPYYTGKKQYELTNHLGNVLATISDRKIGVSLAADSSLIDHYEADVQTAQDYYPFGMVMPGRMFTALTIPGGSVTGTTQVNGFTVPVDLALTTRTGNEPTQYTATRTIDLDEGFESGTDDDVTAYLTDTSYAGTGNGGSGADGVAGASKYAYSFNGKRKDNEIQGEGNTYEYGAREYDPRGVRFWSVDPIAKSYPELTPYQFASNRPIDGNDLEGKEWNLGTVNENLRKIPQIRYDEMMSRAGSIKTWDGQPNFWGKMKDNIEKMKTIPGGTSGYQGLKVLYGIIDDAHVTYTTWKYGPGYGSHLDNSSVSSYKEAITSGVNTASLFFGGLQTASERTFITTSIGLQGEFGEQIFGSNLNTISKGNFPVFDHFEEGVATSAKTIDLSAITYQNKPRAITSTLNGYVNKIANFNEITRNGFTLTASDIETRELGILTLGQPNPAQLSAIQSSQKYAASKGVEFTLKSTSSDPLASYFNKLLLSSPKPSSQMQNNQTSNNEKN